jgi:hypothetical protein
MLVTVHAFTCFNPADLSKELRPFKMTAEDIGQLPEPHRFDIVPGTDEVVDDRDLDGNRRYYPKDLGRAARKPTG